MRLIPLSHGLSAVVDDSDYEWLSQWKWRAFKRPRCSYARRSSDGVFMHRIILQVNTPDVQVDHRNHDGLDNRRGNIRTCTFAENMRNKRAATTCKSGVRGVFYDKANESWRASIYHDGKAHYLGYFKTVAEAAAARSEAAKILHKEFAVA